MSTASTSQLVNNATTATPLPFPDLVLSDRVTRIAEGSIGVRYALIGSLTRDDSNGLYKQTLNDLIAGVRRFTIDCQCAGYLDSYALEQIKRLSYKVLEQRGTLSFVEVGAELADLLEATHFNRLFTIARRST